MDKHERGGSLMRTLLGIAALVIAFALNAPAAIAASDKVSPAGSQAAKSPIATDFSAHRRHHRVGHGHRAHVRPYAPAYYYDRPVYYRPYPYPVPAPFVFGIGYGPWW
jgi:hypothetical protein